MTQFVWRAGAVVALALLSTLAASAQAPTITVESLEWDPAAGGMLVVSSNAPADWRLGLWYFQPDAGWSPITCYGLIRQTSGPYANKFVMPMTSFPKAVKLALYFVLPSETGSDCGPYRENLPTFVTFRPYLVLTRNNIYNQTVDFAGRTWVVKDSQGMPVGPGPNRFCASNTSVDSAGKLHLRIQPVNGYQCGSEIILKKPLGYGRYQFTLDTPLSAMHPNAVLGVFTWSADAPAPHREIDIELSQWAGTTQTNAQFVVQPYTTTANMLRFNAPPNLVPNTFSFDWAPGSVQFAGPNVTFEVTGNGVPMTADETVRLNLYWYGEMSGGVPQEVVISNFEFTPSTRMGVTPASDLSLAAPAAGLHVPTLNVSLPDPWSFQNLPSQVRAVRVGSTGVVDFTVMPNWSTQARVFNGTVGTRNWQVVQLGADGTVEQRTVGMLYNNLLGRLPSDEQRDYQVVKALHQGASTGELATRFFTSQEFQLTGHFVAGLYAGLLCRDPEYSGWLWQRDALQTGLQTRRGMVSSFVNSQEFQLRHGSDNASLVRGIYRCALGRLPSDAELQFQLSALTGGLSKTDFALSVLSSPEFLLMTDRQVTAFLLYATLLNRDASAAEKAGWVNVLASTPLRNVIDGFVNAPEFGLGLQ